MWFFSPDGTDDGQMFGSTVESAAMNFGNPVLWKYFRRVTVLGRGKFNLQFKRNYRTGIYRTTTIDLRSASDAWNTGTWNTGDWGPDSNVKRVVVGTDLYVVAISVCVSDSETTVGTQVVPVGSKDVPVPLCEWALFQVAFDGNLLGLRGD